MRAEIYEHGEDSRLLQRCVRKYAKGRLLDMGTGSGIQALTAMEKTNDVLAVDINEDAVDLAKSKGINAIVSDLFSNVTGKFDTIIFNPPYLPEDDCDAGLSTALSGGKEGSEILEKFLKEAKKHLAKSGKILFIGSSLTGDINGMLEKYGYRIIKMETESFFFEKVTAYVISANDESPEKIRKPRLEKTKAVTSEKIPAERRSRKTKCKA